jgi:hypothetical protein
MSVEKPNSTKVNVHVKKETGDGKTEWVQEERELNHDDFAAYMQLHSLLDGVKAQTLNYFLSGANSEERAQRLKGINTEMQELSSTNQCATDDQCPPNCRCVNGSCVS